MAAKTYHAQEQTDPQAGSQDDDDALGDIPNVSREDIADAVPLVGERGLC